MEERERERRGRRGRRGRGDVSTKRGGEETSLLDFLKVFKGREEHFRRGGRGECRGSEVFCLCNFNA